MTDFILDLIWALCSHLASSCRYWWVILLVFLGLCVGVFFCV